MAFIIILPKVVVKQLAYEQTIREQTLAGILMKTRVGSTSILVSLNPSNFMLFSDSGFEDPTQQISMQSVRVKGVKPVPNPHLQNNQKCPRQISQI